MDDFNIMISHKSTSELVDLLVRVTMLSCADDIAMIEKYSKQREEVITEIKERLRKDSNHE